MSKVWLFHPNLFKNWTVEKVSWVQNLGWFDKLADIAESSSEWCTYNTHALQQLDPSGKSISDILDQPNADQSLYCYDEEWIHINGPIIFRAWDKCVGVCGPIHLIKNLKEYNDDPWQWPNIHIIDVDPTLTLTYHSKSFARGINLPLVEELAGWSVVQDSCIAGVINTNKIIHKLSDTTWLVRNGTISITDIQMPYGYNVPMLRKILWDTTTTHAWVSDSRQWSGWLPDGDEDLDTLHVWNNTLFLNVKEFLQKTEGETLITSYPKINFHVD
jgi:hypothetical protein